MAANPPYAGPVTFLGVEPGPRDNAKFTVLGVPWDGAVSNRAGQRFGPRNIRTASMMLTQEEHPVFKTAPSSVLQDLGDIVLPMHSIRAQTSLENNLRAILVQQGLVDRHVEPIIFGGDHSLTQPILRTLAPLVGGTIGLLHLDAHHDNWYQVFDEYESHGTWVSQLRRMNVIDPHGTVQIGVRSPSNPLRNEDLANRGACVMTARQAMKREPADVANLVTEFFDNRPVWFTLDIDCLDPAYAPGVGTPEVGGLTTMWLLEFIECLRDVNFVGMDVMEVADNDVNQITALAAATAAWTYMAMRMR